TDVSLLIVFQTGRAYSGSRRTSRCCRTSSVRCRPQGFLTNTNGRQIAFTFSGMPQSLEWQCTRTGSCGGMSCESQLHQNDGNSTNSDKKPTKHAHAQA